MVLSPYRKRRRRRIHRHLAWLRELERFREEHRGHYLVREGDKIFNESGDLIAVVIPANFENVLQFVREKDGGA